MQSKISWQPDAANIDVSAEDFEQYVVKTSRIKTFFREKKRIIVAPKGFGKTLLLKYSLNNLNDTSPGFVRVPISSMMDTFDNRLGYERSLQSYLQKYQNWEDLWQVSICISVLAATSVKEQNAETINQIVKTIEDCASFSGELLSNLVLLSDKLHKKVGIPKELLTQFNPSYILVLLLRSSPKQLIGYLDSLRSKSHQLVLAINRRVVVFIDQTDQGISDYDENIWINAQCGLVGAIFKLSAQSQIMVFTSIRMEAWDGFEHEQKSQMRGLVLELEYSDNELKEIFKNSIEVIELYGKNKKTGSPISAFCGVDDLSNTYTNDSEGVFTYILRHTLRRPRDLVLLGDEFHKSNEANELSYIEFTKLVNRIPARDINDSFFVEVARFFRCFQEVKREYLFSLFSNNVLTRENVIDICDLYNDGIMCFYRENKGQMGMHECAKCPGKNYIFSDLYRVGLIGIVVEESNIDGSKRLQEFRKVGSIGKGVLPHSDYYLLHPAMDHIIRKKYNNNKYQPYRGILIGHGEEWKPKHTAIICLTELLPILDNHNIPIEIKHQIQTLIDTAQSVNDKNELKCKVDDIKSSIFGKISSKGIGDAASTVNNIMSALQHVSNILN